jgi:hypothetical protein
MELHNRVGATIVMDGDIRVAVAIEKLKHKGVNRTPPPLESVDKPVWANLGLAYFHLPISDHLVNETNDFVE